MMLTFRRMSNFKENVSTEAATFDIDADAGVGFISIAASASAMSASASYCKPSINNYVMIRIHYLKSTKQSNIVTVAIQIKPSRSTTSSSSASFVPVVCYRQNTVTT